MRNPVNVKRSSVRLEPDAADPSKLVLCFTFDATVSGKLAVFWVAQEGPCCSFRPLHPHLHQSPAVSFEKGLNQKFRQSTEAAVSLGAFPEEQLMAVATGQGVEVFPLVICMVSHKAASTSTTAATEDKGSSGSQSGPSGGDRTLGEASPEAGSGDLLGVGSGGEGALGSVLPGQPLDASVQAQMTYAVLKRRAAGAPAAAAAGAPGASTSKGAEPSAGALPQQQPQAEGYDVKVVKQRIWVDGAEYDLQEIYGMESCAGNGGDRAGDGAAAADLGSSGDASGNSDDIGTDCVICLAAPRNTTVLPCRHMCMCGECAEVLRFQSNKCPICRHTVEGLLQIKLKSKGNPAEQKSAAEQSKTESASGNGTGAASASVDALRPPPTSLPAPPPPPPQHPAAHPVAPSAGGAGSSGASGGIPQQAQDSFLLSS